MTKRGMPATEAEIQAEIRRLNALATQAYHNRDFKLEDKYDGRIRALRNRLDTMQVERGEQALVSLDLSERSKQILLRASEALAQLEGLRTFPSGSEMSSEAAVLVNRLGKLFIYLRWLLKERIIPRDEIRRETLLTLVEIEGKVADVVTRNEGYG